PPPPPPRPTLFPYTTLFRSAALTAAQQQNIATLVDQKGIGARPNPANGYGPGPGFGRGPGDRNVIGDSEAAAATYLGTTTADLETKQRAGQTLAQIANATAGKSRDGLLNALVADATAKIDAAQKAGTITADQATQLKANLTTREQQFVDSNRPGFGRGFPFGQAGPGRYDTDPPILSNGAGSPTIRHRSVLAAEARNGDGGPQRGLTGFRHRRRASTYRDRAAPAVGGE